MRGGWWQGAQAQVWWLSVCPACDILAGEEQEGCHTAVQEVVQCTYVWCRYVWCRYMCSVVGQQAGAGQVVLRRACGSRAECGDVAQVASILC